MDQIWPTTQNHLACDPKNTFTQPRQERENNILLPPGAILEMVSPAILLRPPEMVAAASPEGC